MQIDIKLINNLNAHGYKNYQVLQCSNRSCVMMGFDMNNRKVLLKSFIKNNYNSDCFMVLPNSNIIVPKEFFFLYILKEKNYVPNLLAYYDERNWAIIVMEFLDEEWSDLFNLLDKFHVNEYCLKIIIKNLILAMYELSKIGLYVSW